MADFNELLPEEADVQDQRLIHDLRRMYRTDTQTIEPGKGHGNVASAYLRPSC